MKDVPLREMAIQMLDELIQELWESKKWNFRKSTFSFNTSSGIEEYGLNKLAGDITLNTMRGSDPVRRLRFEPSHDFFKKRPYELSSGDPDFYRDGEYFGCQTQPSASSTVTFVSSLANYTTGTVNVIYGSQRVSITTGSITLDMLGRWILVGTDVKKYKIISIDSSSVFYIHEPYEGTTNATATFAIGDVQQKGIVVGMLDNGTVLEEEVQLNGATSVVSINSFASIIRISKSDKTHGYMTATSNGGLVTNAILDPGETEADYKTIKLHPIPDKEERISFESYGRHPHLYKSTDSPLVPSQFHNLLVLDLFIKIKTEWRNQEVSQSVIDRRNNILERMNTWDNDLDDWNAKQESDDSSGRTTNLPSEFGTIEDY